MFFIAAASMPPPVVSFFPFLHSFAIPSRGNAARIGKVFAAPLADYSSLVKISPSLVEPYRPPGMAGGIEPCLLEVSDVDRVSALLVECLGSGEMFLGGGEGDAQFSGFERKLLQAPVGVWNAYARSANRFETSLGLRVRSGDRLDEFSPTPIEKSFGPLSIEVTPALPSFDLMGRASLVLVMLAKPNSKMNEGDFSSSNDIVGSFYSTAYDSDSGGDEEGGEGGKEDFVLVGAAELAMQPPDGVLPSNFPQLFEGLGLVDSRRSQEEIELPPLCCPYICNVAVSPGWRRRGVGTRLVELCEAFAKDQWGQDVVYLHVEKTNQAAFELYENMGYRPCAGKKNKEENKGSLPQGAGSGDLSSRTFSLTQIATGLFDGAQSKVTYMQKYLRS